MSIRVIGLCGSLRQGSFNRKILGIAQAEATAQNIELAIGDIAGIPLYDADLQDQGFPESVLALGRHLAASDAVLIVSPEYNYSVPGVLKNAIDWLSRLPEQPLAGKPVAIMGASMGMIGTARMQYHLRQILVFLDAHPINKPEVMIGAVHEKFDAQGQLTDPKTREMIQRSLSALRDWTRRLAD